MAAGRLVKVRFDKTEDNAFGLVDDADPRYQYKHQELPCWLYHATEAPIIVQTKEGKEKRMKAGWKTTPIRRQDGDFRDPPPEIE